MTWRTRSGLAIWTLVMMLATSAAGQIRIANYNVARITGDAAALEDVIQGLMDDDKPGFVVPISIFVFQEVSEDNVAELAAMITAAAPPGVSYSTATFTSFGEDAFAGAQACFYRSDLLFEDTSEHADIFTGSGRYTDRWKLDLVGYDAAQASIYLYGTHLPAGTTNGDEADRLAGAQAIRADSNGLPAGTHILYAGDFNFSDHLEAGYQHLLTAGIGQALDPLTSNSWSGSGNAIKHSQSPRVIQQGGLAGGGVDDRFDFQLTGTQVIDDDGIALIPGTYRSFGNDGNHYNLAINDGTNTYYPADIPRSNALADDLHDASDHLPVLADYQIPAVMLAGVNPFDIDRVVQGVSIDVSVFVFNQATPDVAIGGDTLDYQAAGSDGIIGLTSGSVPALGEPDITTLSVDTSVVGALDGLVTVTALSEATQDPVAARTVAGTILAPASPSFDAGAAVTSTTVELAVEADTGVHPIDVPVHNFGFDEATQTLLDVDATSPVAEPFASPASLPVGIGAAAGALTFMVDSAGLAGGQYETVVTIDTSDEDLAGETTHGLTLTLTVTVGEDDPCPADVTGDGSVDVSDLLEVLGAFGSACGDCAADATGDGLVNVDDLLAVLSAWGRC